MKTLYLITKRREEWWEAREASLHAELAAMKSERDGLAEVVEAIVSRYSRLTGLIDIPATCRKMPGSCWCGCHSSEMAESTRVAREKGK